MKMQHWQQSTYCHADGCVEVCDTSEYILIRRSNDDRAPLTFTYKEWEAFTKGVKAGEFD